LEVRYGCVRRGATGRGSNCDADASTGLTASRHQVVIEDGYRF